MAKHLTEMQRYQISTLQKNHFSISQIAQQIGVHKSTVFRELKRNSTTLNYYPKIAQQKTEKRAKEKHKKKKLTNDMKQIIKEKLKLNWSPEQVVGRCKKEGIEMVSHETIYQFIRDEKAHGNNLQKHLRCGGRKYRKSHIYKASAAHIPNRISIEERPAIVDEKSRIGDWEIDTIIGKNHQGAIATAVERKSKFMVMVKLKSKKKEDAQKGIINLLAPFKNEIFTITSDNGFEFRGHEKIAQKLDAKYFFAHPFSSWERGLNENTNKLIRQYIPKKSTFENISHLDIINIIESLNQRPRKTLNFTTPNEYFFNQSVALVS